MSNPMDEYLDRINAGTAEATPEAFAQYQAEVQARIEKVVAESGIAEAVSSDGPENREYITVDIQVVNHTRGTVSNEVIQVNSYEIGANGHKFTVKGRSVKTQGPIVASWEYPEQ